MLKQPASKPAIPPPSGDNLSPIDMPPQGGEPMPNQNPEASAELGQEFDSAENQLEDQDPTKAIQKMVGKLTEKMRTADDQIMTSEFQKGVLNSIISAIRKEKMEDNDLLSVIKKLKGEENAEAAGGQPSNSEFTDDSGIDYNTNSPANSENQQQPLAEEEPFNDTGEPTMTHQQYRDYSEPSEPDYNDNDQPQYKKGIGNFENIDWKVLYATILQNSKNPNSPENTTVNDLIDYDGILSSDELDLLKYGGADIWYDNNGDVPVFDVADGVSFPTYEEFYTKAKDAFAQPENSNIDSSENDSEAPYMRGYEPMSESKLTEEIFNGNQPTFDDNTMPNIVQSVTDSMGVEVNQANKNDIDHAVKLFVQTYSNDQNQTGFMKQLKDYMEQNPGLAEAANYQFTYSSLSPLGQDMFDRLEVIDPSMGQMETMPDNLGGTVKPMYQTATSASPALAAESTQYMKNIILEVLNQK